jgi:hypothetical protein
VKLSKAVACDAAAGCLGDALFAAEMAGTDALAPDAAVPAGLVPAGVAEPHAEVTTTRLASARRPTVRRRYDGVAMNGNATDRSGRCGVTRFVACAG